MCFVVPIKIPTYKIPSEPIESSDLLYRYRILMCKSIFNNLFLRGEGVNYTFGQVEPGEMEELGGGDQFLST